MYIWQHCTGSWFLWCNFLCSIYIACNTQIFPARYHGTCRSWWNGREGAESGIGGGGRTWGRGTAACTSGGWTKAPMLETLFIQPFLYTEHEYVACTHRWLISLQFKINNKNVLSKSHMCWLVLNWLEPDRILSELSDKKYWILYYNRKESNIIPINRAE